MVFAVGHSIRNDILQRKMCRIAYGDYRRLQGFREPRARHRHDARETGLARGDSAQRYHRMYAHRRLHSTVCTAKNVSAIACASFAFGSAQSASRGPSGPRRGPVGIAIGLTVERDAARAPRPSTAHATQRRTGAAAAPPHTTGTARHGTQLASSWSSARRSPTRPPHRHDGPATSASRESEASRVGAAPRAARHAVHGAARMHMQGQALRRLCARSVWVRLGAARGSGQHVEHLMYRHRYRYRCRYRYVPVCTGMYRYVPVPVPVPVRYRYVPVCTGSGQHVEHLMGPPQQLAHELLRHAAAALI